MSLWCQLASAHPLHTQCHHWMYIQVAFTHVFIKLMFHAWGVVVKHFTPPSMSYFTIYVYMSSSSPSGNCSEVHAQINEILRGQATPNELAMNSGSQPEWTRVITQKCSISPQVHWSIAINWPVFESKMLCFYCEVIYVFSPFSGNMWIRLCPPQFPLNPSALGSSGPPRPPPELHSGGQIRFPVSKTQGRERCSLSMRLTSTSKLHESV